MFSTIAARLPVLAIALALFGAPAFAQPGKIETKSYERIGKEKIQVDLTLADTGVLYRDLRDYLKDVLTARGNPVGKSGPLAAKLNVSYAQPIEPGGGIGVGPTGPSGPSGPNPGVAVPDRTAPAFRRDVIPPARGNALRVGITVYREQGGKVVWSGEASCTTAFANASAAGHALIDQLVNLIDQNRTGAAECPN